MYYATPTDLFRQAGISTVIWANHLLRASITAMRETAPAHLRGPVAARGRGPRRQRAATSSAWSATPSWRRPSGATCRARPRRTRRRAGGVARRPGRRADRATSRNAWSTCAASRCCSGWSRRSATAACSDITVVRGYRKEAVAVPGIKTVDNDRYAETGEVYSLACAREASGGRDGGRLWRRAVPPLHPGRPDVERGRHRPGGRRAEPVGQAADEAAARPGGRRPALFRQLPGRRRRCS